MLIKDADSVVSERVHVFAASLSFGTPAQCLPYSARSTEKCLLLFDSVGLSSITKRPVLLDKALISQKKIRPRVSRLSFSFDNLIDSILSIVSL